MKRVGRQLRVKQTVLRQNKLLALYGLVQFVFFEKFTRAYLLQIALEAML